MEQGCGVVAAIAPPQHVLHQINQTSLPQMDPLWKKENPKVNKLCYSAEYTDTMLVHNAME